MVYFTPFAQVFYLTLLAHMLSTLPCLYDVITLIFSHHFLQWNVNYVKFALFPTLVFYLHIVCLPRTFDIIYIYISLPLHCRPLPWTPRPNHHTLKASGALVSKSRSILYCKTAGQGFNLQVPYAMYSFRCNRESTQTDCISVKRIMYLLFVWSSPEVRTSVYSQIPSHPYSSNYRIALSGVVHHVA
jgi:hypothetical protein